MKNPKFKYAGAWNFLPFGPEGIEINFDHYGNIVLISGENRDAKQLDPDAWETITDESRISSNGTGKSSLQEIIVYGLFGKTVKRPDKLGVNDVVHNKIGKDCKIELIFDKYRIVRTRKEGGKENKNSLQLWESEDDIWDKSTEITQGTMAATQKKIEDKIGLSYDAFINMCIFTDDQRACFLECDNPKKKEIVENLLSLGIFREWHETAKELRKEINGLIVLKIKEYQLLLGNKDDANRRLMLTKKKQEDWCENKKNEISNLLKTIDFKKKELATTDNGAALLVYRDAQDKIKQINDLLPVLKSDKDELEKKLKLAVAKEDEQKTEAQILRTQYEEHSFDVKTKVNERKNLESEIQKHQALEPGTKCTWCHGQVHEENISSYIEELQNKINDINIDLQVYVVNTQSIATKIEDLKARQTKVAAYIKQFREKISNIDYETTIKQSELATAARIREPKADSAEFLLEQQIVELKEQINNKEKELNGRSPYQDILDNDQLELDAITANVTNKDQEVKELEGQLPYFNYWIKGFGEHGIRKWVIDGIIPDLNSRVNYWLQYLIDNKITVTFDNELNEKIERNPIDGDPYIYHAMSTGQRRRLNLAVSQSFAYIMAMSAETIPSIVFLDEVTTNVDPLGVQGIYNMICELAEDKQVFLTTHDPDLIRMLQGVDVIKLVHENGFAKLVK